MCKKVVVLFSNPHSPPEIRKVLSGIGTTFFQVDTKNLIDKLKGLGVGAILMDSICPKIAKKVFNAFPSDDIKVAYVGGKPNQLQALPSGAVIWDNWPFARKALDPAAA